MRNIYLTIKLVVEDDADVDELVSELDYSFDHDDIIATEIVDVSDYQILR